MAEHKCVLSQSCCGCSLRSGSLAIGILGLVGSILRCIEGVYRGVNGDNEGWVALVVGLISVVLCALLIQGIRKEQRSWIMVWVWVQIVLVAINAVLGVISIILTLNIIGAVILFIVLGIFIYCILVVRSYALSLGSGGSGGMA